MASRQPGIPVTRCTIDRGRADPARWPYTLPAVAQILAAGLDLRPGVTVLIGENGSGKSTLVEAIAAAWAKRVTAFRADAVQRAINRPAEEDSDLNASIRLDYTGGGPNGGLFLRAERWHGQAEIMQAPGSTWSERLGQDSLLARSHGEGFLAVLGAMTHEAGLYVLDEPESALSFTSSLALLQIMQDMQAAGSQILVATHSPVLASFPGAQILEIGTLGIRSVEYDDCDLVQSWRSFLAGPQRYLRHLT